MALTKIAINPQGGTIKAEVRFTTPQVAAYIIRLWESGSNDVVMEVSGNNDNPADDIHPLPIPASANQGRLLQCNATLADPVGSGPYRVELEVTQDGNSLGVLFAQGNMSNSSVSCSLFAKLT
jgi:hypothetical protein